MHVGSDGGQAEAVGPWRAAPPGFSSIRKRENDFVDFDRPPPCSGTITDIFFDRPREGAAPSPPLPLPVNLGIGAATRREPR